MGWMSMNLAMLQNVCEEADSLEQVSQLKGELPDAKDDLELRETLRNSSKKNVAQLEGQLEDLRKEVKKENKSLSERDELLTAEKKKAGFNAAKLKESEKEVAQHKGQLLELQSTLDSKEENWVAELTEAGYYAYREAVRFVKFLNPSVELNLRGLDPFHGVKDGQFWDFRDHRNPVLLDPNSMESFNCDSLPPAVDEEVNVVEDADGGMLA
jgi:hypothetical protein